MEKFNIKVHNITDLDNGEALVELELSEEFTDWFCKIKNLDKFSNEEFQIWFSDAIKQGLELIEKSEPLEHTKDCGWHKDWHDCTCGAFDQR
jgi:hypothetical protein